MGTAARPHRSSTFFTNSVLHPGLPQISNFLQTSDKENYPDHPYDFSNHAPLFNLMFCMVSYRRDSANLLQFLNSQIIYLIDMFRR